ncbi:MAG: hypothetical protein J2O48_03905 [Solirubrobacterales bacterium]|nr:hypothetical protein [Solirubrobacterales bacterium]
MRAVLSAAAAALVPQDVRALVDVRALPEDDFSGFDFSDTRFLATPPRGRRLLPELPRMPELEVIQVASAGTDWIEGHLPSGVTLCNARGARDAPVAEWTLGALLGASSGLLEASAIKSWRHGVELQDLSAWTVLVVGMGSIGRKLEQFLAPLGTRVIGVVSQARDGLHGTAELPELIPSADAVVVLTPLTESTRHLIGARELAAMADGAVLINAGRGAVVDTDALLTELQRGRIRAVLDVTDPEPLPDGHPLWHAPGLLAITPHLAGASAGGHHGAAQLAADQLGRWARGEPLANVVTAGG